ncbi:uncharacterized protein [Antedon mediterranea]|uniref:uncharacterized protein n=1 Tax=Antedon mediterranea TaxID=105859 RepID=UPI003AF455E7
MEAVSSKAEEIKTKKSTNRMIWDNQKDQILIGEVILARPFQSKKGTTERGKAWQAVADAMKAREYKVDRRAVRDRISNLMDKVKGKNNKEKAASGIAVEETDEEKYLRIRESIEEFIQEEEDIEMLPKERGDEEKKKADGAEMRKRACETFGETRKRLDVESNTPKRRNSGNDTIGIIQKKMEIDQQLRREEMERKKRGRRTKEGRRRRAEERGRERRFEAFQQQQLQQQQQMQQQILQQQQLLQHQNQQTQTLMMAFLKSMEKKN